MTKENFTQERLENYTNQLIQHMEEMTTNWQQGWMGATNQMIAGGFPTNLKGRQYNGMNALFLFLVSAEMGYKSQTWLTVKQANEAGYRIKKGEKGSDIFFWKRVIKDEQGNTVKPEDYHNMSDEERSHTHNWGILKFFNVFNIEQTNMAEVDPDKFAKLIGEAKHEAAADTTGMYQSDELDAMIYGEDGWLCPIFTGRGDRAFYRPGTDTIDLPAKILFKVSKDEDGIFADGQEFYSTAIHEMIHSTGSSKRLNREGGSKFGDKKYAKEELVAELSAAVLGASFGFVTRVQENNAAYLKSWIKAMKEEPKFLISVLADVSKAVNMFNEQLNKVATAKAVAA
jgi:antirestriction protein ArdC